MSSQIEHRSLSVNGIQLHVAVQGQGPLVVLLHGFPELWSAWHSQIPALAAAGFRVAAPDLRGFGQSDAPDHPHSYSVLHVAGDVLGIIHALGESTAVVVGHDWGAPVAWTSALIRPDVIRGVVGLSVPYRARTPKPPLQTLREAGLGRYYLFYMQSSAAADELARDVPETMRRILSGEFGGSRQAIDNSLSVPEGSGFLDAFPPAQTLPEWVDRDHFSRLVSEYQRTGFRVPLYLYHNLDLNWELLAAWSGKPIEQPALFLGGDRDPSLTGEWGMRALTALPSVVPNVKVEMLEGAGHWLQQERPAEVTRALLDFLNQLPAKG